MILVDIDGSISPTNPDSTFTVPSTEAEAGGFPVLIPNFIIDFLRAREDIVMLSTWGEMAADVPRAFGFNARVAVLEDFTEEPGIAGKFEVAKLLNPDGWIDDHIKPAMKRWAKEEGVALVVPQGHCMTERQLARFKRELEGKPLKAPTEARERLWTA